MYDKNGRTHCDGCYRTFREGDRRYEAAKTAHDLCGACAAETTTESVRLVTKSHTPSTDDCQP